MVLLRLGGVTAWCQKQLHTSRLSLWRPQKQQLWNSISKQEKFFHLSPFYLVSRREMLRGALCSDCCSVSRFRAREGPSCPSPGEQQAADAWKKLNSMRSSPEGQRRVGWCHTVSNNLAFILYFWCYFCSFSCRSSPSLFLEQLGMWISEQLMMNGTLHTKYSCMNLTLHWLPHLYQLLEFQWKFKLLLL